MNLLCASEVAGRPAWADLEEVPRVESIWESVLTNAIDDFARESAIALPHVPLIQSLERVFSLALEEPPQVSPPVALAEPEETVLESREMPLAAAMATEAILSQTALSPLIESGTRLELKSPRDSTAHLQCTCCRALLSRAASSGGARADTRGAGSRAQRSTRGATRGGSRVCTGVRRNRPRRRREGNRGGAKAVGSGAVARSAAGANARGPSRDAHSDHSDCIHRYERLSRFS